MAILLSILMALGLVGGSNVNNQTGIDANDTNNHSTTKTDTSWDWSNNQ